MRRSLLTYVLALMSPIGLLAASSPFAGTWKLEPARSTYSGESLTYSKLDNGSWHFSTSDGMALDISFDGKEKSVGGGYTISQTMDGENAWNSIWKLNGKVTSKDHGQISDDGKTLTLTQNRVRPDGSIGTTVSTLKRVAGTTGPAGTWKLEKSLSEIYTRIISANSEGLMRWEIPENKQVTEGKADGSDLAISGPEVPPGQSEALTLVSPTKVAYTIKLNGKPQMMGTRTVSADGKTLLDESWLPGKESEKSTEVFTKQ